MEQRRPPIPGWAVVVGVFVLMAASCLYVYFTEPWREAEDRIAKMLAGAVVWGVAGPLIFRRRSQ